MRLPDVRAFSCFPEVCLSLSLNFMTQSLARPTSDSLRQFVPLPNELQQSYQRPSLLDTALRSAVKGVLANIDGVSFVQLDPPSLAIDSPNPPPSTQLELFVKASRNSWSRAERRKRTAGASNAELNSPAAPMLTCIIRELASVISTTAVDGETKKLVIQCSWIRGRDRGLFESFWSHVSRKVGVALGGP